MLRYEPPVAEYMFLLEHVFDLDRYRHLEGYDDLDLSLIEAVLTEAGKLGVDVMLPLNASGDREGCQRRQDGSVSTPTGFREAYRAYTEGGWAGISSPAEYGGQDLPRAVTTAVQEFGSACNQAFDMYTGWGDSAASILMAHGSTAQRETYLPKLINGDWSATMALTEPHCGTDIGLIRTKAIEQADGSYKISGTKIFNSGGDHDLTENIVHFVLARVDGDPAGTKGISLFLMPKFLVAADGSLGERNAVSCGALEHKMGLKGSATCLMNYDGATGWLVGERCRGMAAMFRLMNLIRRRTGTMALAVSEIATQNAVAYCSERLQGRALSGAKFPNQAADPLIVHPDVRRSLMHLKCTNEASRALMVWSGLVADISIRSPDAGERVVAADRLTLITPVIKAFLSDICFENVVTAQQMFGGHGYMADTGIEQLVRDIRMLSIAEGANGVQGVDLVLRKLAHAGGQATVLLFQEIDDQVAASRLSGSCPALVDGMARSLADLRDSTQVLVALGRDNPEAAAVGASDYLQMFGLVLLGFMYMKLADAAGERTDELLPKAQRRTARVTRARYFADRILPETALLAQRVRSAPDTVMGVEIDHF